MIAPSVFSRIEKTNELAGGLSDGTHVTAFMSIAVKTGCRQILHDGFASVFEPDYMVNFACVKQIIFMNQAILADTVGSFDDPAAHIVADVNADALVIGAPAP